MKKVIVFIGLKIVEITGLGLLLYLLSLLGSLDLISKKLYNGFWGNLLEGCTLAVLIVSVVIIVGVVLFALWVILEKNWEWANDFVESHWRK